jgi:hypothetical protein
VAVSAANTVFCAGLPFTSAVTCGALAIDNSTSASMALQPTVSTTTIYAAGTMAATARINFSATYYV